MTDVERVEKLSSLQEFHDKVDGVLGFVDLDELDNIGLLEELHEMDFVHQSGFPEFLGLDVSFVEGLDSAVDLGTVVLGEVDLSERSLTEHLNGMEFGVEVSLNGDCCKGGVPLVKQGLVGGLDVAELLVVDELDVAGVLFSFHELELSPDPAERHASSNLRLSFLSLVVEMGIGQVEHSKIVVIKLSLSGLLE